MNEHLEEQIEALRQDSIKAANEARQSLHLAALSVAISVINLVLTVLSHIL